MKKYRWMVAVGKKERRWLDQWISLVLLVAGCVAPTAQMPGAEGTVVSAPRQVSAESNARLSATPTAESVPPTPAPTATPGPRPTPRTIVVPSGGGSSSVTVRPVTSTPTPTPQPTPTANATALAIAEGAAPLIFIGLSRDQKCGRGDVVAVDGHELLATPRLLVGIARFSA